MKKRIYHNGDELFHNNHTEKDFCVCDFWHFAFGDLLDNTYRGHLAEFIVAKALGLNTEEHREDWSEYDILYEKTRLEIKSSAYIQSWNLDNDRYSQIQFSIAPAHKFDSNIGNYLGDKLRHSDFYIFCLYAEQNKNAYDILDLSKWFFYVLPTSTLNEKCTTQRTISMSALTKLNAVKCGFDDLKNLLNEMIKNNKQ